MVHSPTSETPNMPASALLTDSTLLEIRLNINSTPEKGGSVLGIVKPVWQRALEGEMRISWSKDMLDRDLVLRDILKFGHVVSEKFRVESSKEGEMGRKFLIEIMRVKYKDELRYYRECKKLRESLRDYLRKKYGRQKYNKLMDKIKDSLEGRRRELADKFSRNTQFQFIKSGKIVAKLYNFCVDF